MFYGVLGKIDRNEMVEMDKGTISTYCKNYFYYCSMFQGARGIGSDIPFVRLDVQETKGTTHGVH